MRFEAGRLAISVGAGRDGSGLSRREILAGGIGAGALVALPDLGLSGRSGQTGFFYLRVSGMPFFHGMPDPASLPRPLRPRCARHRGHIAA